jgi:hypothetical protein
MRRLVGEEYGISSAASPDPYQLFDLCPSSSGRIPLKLLRTLSTILDFVQRECMQRAVTLTICHQVPRARIMGTKALMPCTASTAAFLPIGTHSPYCSDREQTPKLIAAPERTQRAGIRASEVAEITAQTILDGRFWIFAHQRDLPLHLGRVQAMVSGAHPPKPMPEDTWAT